MDFRHHAELLSRETDLARSLGAFSVLDARTKTCVVPFARAAAVCEPQSDGLLTEYTGSQIPWGPKGVRVDPSWKNFWLLRSGTVTGACSDGTITSVSGTPCTRFTPNSGAVSFPSVGRSAQTISLASGASTDLALSGYLYPSVPGSVALEPYIVVEVNTSGASQVYITAQIDPATGSIRSKTIPTGFTEKQPLSVVAVGNGFRFEWVVTYTQDAALRNTLIAYLQARNSAGNGAYTSDGIAALQYSHLSASFTSHIVPPTQALTADFTVPSFTFGSLMATLGLTPGASYAIGLEYTAANDAQEKVVFGMSSGAFAESIYFTHNNSVSRQSFAMISGGVAQLENTSVNALSGVLQKAVVRIKANDTFAAFNGALATADTACTLPTGLTSLTIGKAPWGGNANDFAGWISRIYVVPLDTVTPAHAQALSYLDLVLALGGIYLLDLASRKCVVPFNRATTVYEPQPNGTYAAYSGAQVPWSASGVQVDEAWQNSCTWGCEINVARDWIVSAALSSGLNTGEIAAPAEGVPYTRLTTLGGSAPHAYKAFTVVPGSTMHVSMLVRLGTLLASEFKVAFYDATAAAFISSEVLPAAVPNSADWTRCNFTVTIPAGCTSMRVYPFRNAAALGAGKTVYLSLVNLTNTSYPVPLTKAEAAAVDVARPSFSGTISETGLSSVGGVYSLFAEYTMFSQSSYPSSRNVLQLDNNTSGQRSLLRWNNAAGTPRAYIVAGTTQFTGSFVAAEGALIKQALRVVPDIPRGSVNGGVNSTTAPITMPAAPTHIRLGREIGGEIMCGVLRRAAIFPGTGLADKYLAALGLA